MGSTVCLDYFRRGSFARSSPASYIIALELPQMRSGATQNQTSYAVGCPNKLLNLVSDSIFKSAAEWARGVTGNTLLAVTQRSSAGDLTWVHTATCKLYNS